jgi:hypothetical protein
MEVEIKKRNQGGETTTKRKVPHDDESQVEALVKCNPEYHDLGKWPFKSIVSRSYLGFWEMPILALSPAHGNVPSAK